MATPQDTGPLPVGAQDPSRGRADALITLVWFADLQCPFSASAATTVAELQKRYAPDQLRVVWKNLPLPFHVAARPAAEHAMAVFALGGATSFWRFVDAATEHYSALEGAPLVEWGVAAGVPREALAAELASGRPAAKVKADEELAARLGARGTPTFFVNGAPLVGAQPLAKFVELIDAERGRAEQALAKGTPRVGLYAELTRSALARATAEPPPEDERDTAVWRVPIGSSPVRGKATALVTVVEFSDFQCPFCRRVQVQLEQLRSKYGDDVRFVFKQSPLPFHPRAEPAAELALEAKAQRGDAGFFDVHDALFGRAGLEDADLEAVAREAHLDLAKVRRSIQAHRYADAIADDLELADELHAAGTPHFFINGRRLVGAQPLEKFTALVDEELAKARALVVSGVSPGAVYDELQKAALGPDAGLVARVPPPGVDQPFLGTRTAKVVVQEFADFECSFCARADTTMQALLAAYPGKIKVVWRHRPLSMHAHAPLASEAAVEAFQQKGNAGFWAYRAMLFGGQGQEGGLERASLVRYAKKLGLDTKRFEAALDDHRHAAAVQADVAIADSAGISGTPTFVINGAVIEGAQPLAKFRRVVDKALR